MSSLQERMQMAIRRIRGKAVLNEDDINQMMREIRLSLLEADVNFSVVKKFTERIKEKALGEKILKGLNPQEQVVKVVLDELKNIMGNEAVPIKYKPSGGMTILMVCGLQGSGKTTSIAKIASFLRKTDKKTPFLIACDVYRPAAVEQLKTLAKQINVPVYDEGTGNPIKIVKHGIEEAKKLNSNLVIIDTAGRLHIDEKMMDELVEINKLVNPDEILLTVDAMTGQDAANIAKSFSDKLPLTGAILTKLDGDTRGGAALSIREVANIPIKFQTSGEKLDTIEYFHPDRIANRILGMGDIVSLIEKAEEAISEDDAKNLMTKIQDGSFNYNDLLKQFKSIKRMGKISKLIGFIPGLGKKVKDIAENIDEDKFYKQQSIIFSMTEEERKNPKLIEKNFKRRQRIAKGCGMQVSDVNRLIEALDNQKRYMKQFSQMDEESLKKIQKNPAKLQSLQQPKVKHKKGKGKNKKGFRF